MPVSARRFLRKMRGGAQAHLLEAADGNYYIVKFANNPQSKRILVNEWIASVLLGYLEITQPKVALIEIRQDFLDANPEVHFQLGSSRKPVEAGLHFGSAFPGDPNKQAVYDFLPEVLLAKVANLAEFLGVLVFDKWAGNSDSRQAIFFRSRLQDWLPTPNAPETKTGFLAQMIDHGFLFDGPRWAFQDSPLSGLYFRPFIYQHVKGFADFDPWLERVRHFPEEVLDQALKQLPPSWLDKGDSTALERLLETLLRRRAKVPDLIADLKRGRVDPFPSWNP